ncbi:hypothetical protein JW905_12790, partial [bacterium]|nr:hypothetical protein [candidate division CSSED10-310 bacterium]
MNGFRWIAACLLVCAAVSGGPGQAAVRYSQPSPPVELVSHSAVVRLHQDGALPWGEPGMPMIPRTAWWIEIEPGHRLVSFSVSHGEPWLAAEGVLVDWLQPPRPLSQVHDASMVPPADWIYASDDAFPAAGDLVLPAGVQCRRGRCWALFLVASLQYRPLSGRVYQVPGITIELTTAPGAETVTGRREAALLDQSMAYLVITSDALAGVFADLVEWKRVKGLSAGIKTVSWVLSNYPGVDDAEKLRNCIIDAYENWHTEYVLLGGDTGVVPFRAAFAMDCEAGMAVDENDIPCDLYFAALDGDWNADGDGIFGEVTDEVDLLAEICVGRAPVSDSPQARAFVDKTIAYEADPAPGYQTDALFLSGILWANPYTDGAVASDMIDDQCVPARFDPITKLYQSAGDLNPAAAIAAMNDGPALVNHIGHAWYSSMSVNGSITRGNVDALVNGDRQFIISSIGCWPAALDRDAIAEHFLYNPVGGAIAFIGNSRYGWGSPGNPGFGYSDVIQREVWCQLLDLGHTRPGAALAEAKAVFAPFAADENVYRWIQYELNLLGDPELAAWIDLPVTPSVTHPVEIPMAGSFHVIVATAAGFVEGASVAVGNGVDVSMAQVTDRAGTAWFEYQTSGPEPFILTVTGAGLRPYQAAITVQATGAFAAFAGWTVDDDQS